MLIAAAIASAGAASARGEASWRLEQPPPPEGAAFKVPLGTPDDMEFYAPNEGLLSVEGNATVPNGLFFYNGRGWRQLATVCGGSGEASRIAWAGPDEFWVITEPSEPRVGAGLGLCHFKDGVVVGSYSTAFQSSDPFRPMDAAACDGPNDCWFAGIGSEDPSGQRIGAFHLHWDGTNLISSYQPQGRGVSGLAFFGGTFFESTFVGTQEGNTTDPVTLVTPEPEADPDPPARRRHVRRRGISARTVQRPAQRSGRAERRHGVALSSLRRERTVVLGRGRRVGPRRPQGRLGARPPGRRAFQRGVIQVRTGADRNFAVWSRRPLRRRRTGAGRFGGVGSRSAALAARQLNGQGQGGADRRRRSHDPGHAARSAAPDAAAPR